MSIARRAARAARRAAAKQVAAADVEVLPGIRARPEDVERIQTMMFDFRDQAEAMTGEAIADGCDAGRLGALLLSITSDLAERSAARPAWACRTGCAACCLHPVGVSAPEAILLAEAARDCLPADELAALAVRLGETAARARAAPSGPAYIRAGIACAFLAPDGSCAAYQARPAVCRGYNSFDAAACAAGLVDGVGRVPQDNLALVGGGALHSGFRDALRRAGLDDGLYELHAALAVALAAPDAAARFQAGERLFDACGAAALREWERG